MPPVAPAPRSCGMKRRTHRGGCPPRNCPRAWGWGWGGTGDVPGPAPAAEDAAFTTADADATPIRGDPAGSVRGGGVRRSQRGCISGGLGVVSSGASRASEDSTLTRCEVRAEPPALVWPAPRGVCNVRSEGDGDMCGGGDKLEAALRSRSPAASSSNADGTDEGAAAAAAATAAAAAAATMTLTAPSASTASAVAVAAAAAAAAAAAPIAALPSRAPPSAPAVEATTDTSAIPAALATATVVPAAAATLMALVAIAAAMPRSAAAILCCIITCCGIRVASFARRGNQRSRGLRWKPSFTALALRLSQPGLRSVIEAPGSRRDRPPERACSSGATGSAAPLPPTALPPVAAAAAAAAAAGIPTSAACWPAGLASPDIAALAVSNIADSARETGGGTGTQPQALAP